MYLFHIGANKCAVHSASEVCTHFQLLNIVSREPIIWTPQYSDTLKANILTLQYSDILILVLFYASHIFVYADVETPRAHAIGIWIRMP